MPFVEKLSGSALCKMFAGKINHTLKSKVQDNQAVAEFENKSNTTAELRKNKVLGILDLRSMGYFKVGYQKIVTMAKSSGNFKMHHYQQVAKGKQEAGLDFTLKCQVTEVHPETLHVKVKIHAGSLGKTLTLGWQRMIPDGSNQMLRFYSRELI